MTALPHCISPSGEWRSEVVQLLLEKGAEVNSRTKDGATPLHVAGKQGCGQVAELLLARGAIRGLKDDHGLTAHDYAARNSHETAAQLLASRNPG